MIKVMLTMYKKAGVSSEEFSKHWKEVHGPLALRLVPGLRGYVQNHVVKMPNLKNEFDGFCEIWFDDLKAYKGFKIWMLSDEGKPIRDDESNFVDSSRTNQYVVEEYVMRARGSADKIKMLLPLYKKASVSSEEFSKHWKEVHGPLVLRLLPGLRGYVQHHVVTMPNLKIKHDIYGLSDINAFAENWYDDLEAYKRSRYWIYSSDEGKLIRDDEVKFVDTSRTKDCEYVVEEHVMR